MGDLQMCAALKNIENRLRVEVEPGLQLAIALQCFTLAGDVTGQLVEKMPDVLLPALSIAHRESVEGRNALLIAPSMTFAPPSEPVGELGDGDGILRSLCQLATALENTLLGTGQHLTNIKDRGACLQAMLHAGNLTDALC